MQLITHHDQLRTLYHQKYKPDRRHLLQLCNSAEA